jgi:glycosyltransferase involved in cell wall biosynthesis
VRIFQVITVSEFGGAQTIVANLSQSLSKSHEIFILYGGDGEAWGHLDPNIHLIRLNEHRKNISFKDIFLTFKLFYLRLKYKPDIVHLHSSKMGAIGRFAFNPKKIVYTVHGFDSIRKAFHKFLIVEKFLKDRAARIIGVSQYDVDCLKEEGIKKNVKRIYNGVADYTQLDHGIEESPLLGEQLKIIKKRYKHVVICLSRISPQKKFDLFLDIAKERPQYAFVWIGNKSPVEDTPSNVFCLGEGHSAHQYLKYADLFILPSNYEGLPMSILEALSYSVPVVASAVGGIAEILNGSNGFAVENTVSAFTEKIDVILNQDVYSDMCKNARESYLRCFSVDKMTENYLSTYNEIYNNQ